MRVGHLGHLVQIACCHTAFERLPVDQLVAAARTLAHFVVSWCGVTEDTQATGMH